VVTWGTGSDGRIDSDRRHVSDPDEDLITVLLVLDGDYSHPITIGSDLAPNSTFHHILRPSDFATKLGEHLIEICGIDDTGMFSRPIKIAIVCEYQATPARSATLDGRATAPFTCCSGATARRHYSIVSTALFSAFWDV
jgi:hypothetical protein